MSEHIPLPDEETAETAAAAAAPAAPRQPQPPPAATAVLEGDRTEETVKLYEELTAARRALAVEAAARRKAETDAAYAQDEARRLRACLKNEYCREIRRVCAA